MLDRKSSALPARPLRALRAFCWLAIASLGLPAAASANVAQPAGLGITPPPTAFAFVGRYATGLAGTSAETAALQGTRMFVSSASAAALDVVDVSNPASPQLLRRLDLTPYGSEVTSVGASAALVAVAVKAATKTDPGSVLILNRDGDLLATARTGAGPDAVAFTPDGRRLLVANEGEPTSYGQPDSIDPEGSVSIVTIPAELAKRSTPRKAPLQSRTIDFRDFNAGARRGAELPASVRVFGPGASVAQDLEPEYIAIAPDGKTAFVTLQENNAVAILALPSGRIRKIVALGYKDHATSALDASDRDSGVGNNGAINIRTWEDVYGMYQPDQIVAFSVDGKTYLLTANEGDARDYDGFAEEERAADVADTDAIPAAASNAQLGRLTVTSATPGGSSGQTALYAFGARSFSIWNADVEQVWDSGDLLERLVARVFPGDFNKSNDGNGGFDSRSDNKGPEPEGAVIGKVGGRTYAFVGLERQGGVVVVDVTDPTAPVLVQYLVTRVFGGSAVGPDSAPEGMSFLANGPNGGPLLAVANEVSGTVALFETVPGDGPTALTVLHNNDGESSLLPFTAGGLTVGGVAAFKTATDREIRSARDAGRSVVNVYAGDAFLAGATLACSNPQDATGPVFDAIAQRRIAYDAHVFGNHEFDFTPTFLERFVREFADADGRLTQPFLSANLDFAGEPTWADLLDADGLIVGEATDGAVVARSMVVFDPTTTARIGVVGATTPLLPTISSPRDVVVTSSDIATTAPIVQAEIDRLVGLGVTKILFVSHLQDIANDVQLIGLLRGVDAAVAGGGDELLANLPADLLIPGDGTGSNPVVGPYPRLVTDADGSSIPLVTTNGNYKYVGRLDVAFDAAGSASVQGGGPKRVVVATGTPPADAVAADFALVAQVQTPVQSCLATLAATPVAETEVVFDRSRPGVRARQANAGNLVADAWLDTYDRNAANVGLPPRDATVIAIQNGGGIRDNSGNFLPGNGVPGVISRLDLLNMLPFDNTMVVVTGVTPAELKQILERATASLPGQGGQFLQLAGLSVTYDPSFPANVTLGDGTITVPGERVREVQLDDGTAIVTGGVVQAGAPDVSIVTNNFTANGGDNYPTLAAKPKTTLRDANGLAIPYELPARQYLESFPIGLGGLPVVSAMDDRYAPNPTGAETRITIVAP